MYVQGGVLAVKGDRQEDYLEMARAMGEIFIDYGALEVIDNWEADVPDGDQTDFRRAVAAENGEKIVFSWIVWPDKAACDKAHEKMMQDERMQKMPEDMPFDGKRMIIGGFSQIFSARPTG